MSANYFNFKLNSDFPTDDVILAEEKDLTYSGVEWSVTFAHGFDFIPLCYGVLEFNGNGVWIPLSNTGDFNLVGGVVVADATNVEVHIITGTQSPTTVKVRILGFLPSDQEEANLNPPTGFNVFRINSENEQVSDMLLFQGKVAVSNNENEQLLVTHNLGYYPRVMAFIEEDGRIRQFDPAYYGRLGEVMLQRKYINVTTTQVWCGWYDYWGDIGNAIIHYRVYGGING